jgi:hypothetical protein
MQVFSTSFKLSSLLLALTLAAGCGSNRTSDSPTPPQSPGADATSPAPTQTAAENPLQPGEYCFTVEADDLTGEARLIVAADNTVTGQTAAAIHNEAEGYYSSYRQDLVGELTGNQLSADITTQIEDDVQNEQETWTVTAEQLDTGRTVYEAADCATVGDRLAGGGGAPSESTDGASTAQGQRVEFSTGENSTVLENSVIRGERDIYLLNAEADQEMILEISSLEDNAVFDVVAPDGLIIAQEETSDRFVLPQTGDYQIIVGGTRGNATYEITVEIN